MPATAGPPKPAVPGGFAAVDGADRASIVVDPAVGSLAFHNVDILVCPSCGSQPVAVPNVHHYDVDEAADELGSVGLHVGNVGTERDPSCDENYTVMRQNPIRPARAGGRMPSACW